MTIPDQQPQTGSIYVPGPDEPFTLQRMSQPVTAPPEPHSPRRKLWPFLAIGTVVLATVAAGTAYALWPTRPAATVASANTATTAAAPPAAESTSQVPSSAAAKLLKLGETKADSIGKAVAYSYKQPVAKSAPRPDQEGFEWGAADVEVCALADDVYINNSSWHLVYADHTLIEPSSIGYRGFPEPSYPWGDKDLAKGRCVRGWITFAVPAGKRPTSIEHDIKDAYAEWAI